MKYHYMISIGIDGIHSSKPGEKYLDNFLEWKEEDNQKVQLALEMMKNKLWTTTKQEAIKAVGLYEILSAMHSILIRSAAQDTMIFYFQSNHRWRRENFESYISYTSIEEMKGEKILCK